MLATLTYRGLLTDNALNTNGSPAILLLEMLKCVKRLPVTEIKSESAVLETALLEEQELAETLLKSIR